MAAFKVSIPSNRGIPSDDGHARVQHRDWSVSIPSNRGIPSDARTIRTSRTSGWKSQSPRIGAYLRTITDGKIGSLFSMSSQSPRIGAYLRTVCLLLKRTSMFWSLNPLESGHTFGHSILEAMMDKDAKSQSPRIGAYLRT